MTVSAFKKLREAGSPKPTRRRVARRLSATHLLIAVVVILAFVLNLLVLTDRDATTLVAVADERLRAGSTLDAAMLRLVPVGSSFEGLPSLIDSDQVSDYEGWVLGRSIEEGSLVDESSLIAPTDGERLRSMSLPVGVEHAIGGSLVPGDRVDVIAVVDGNASFVAVDLEVMSVSDDDGGSIGAVSSYHVVVAVESDDALRLAEALEGGSMEIVRSTGATEVGGRTLSDG